MCLVACELDLLPVRQLSLAVSQPPLSFLLHWHWLRAQVPCAERHAQLPGWPAAHSPTILLHAAVCAAARHATPATPVLHGSARAVLVMLAVSPL